MHQTAEQRSDHHSTEQVSTAPESSNCVLYTLFPALGIVLGDVRLACSCLPNGNPFHEAPTTVFVLILMPVEVCSSSGGISRVSVTFTHHVPQHSVLCWVSAVHKRFHFPIIPFTVDHGISSRDEMSQIDVAKVASYHSTMFEFIEEGGDNWSERVIKRQAVLVHVQ